MCATSDKREGYPETNNRAEGVNSAIKKRLLRYVRKPAIAIMLSELYEITTEFEQEYKNAERGVLPRYKRKKPKKYENDGRSADTNRKLFRK
jgi:hypothetical protein